MNEINSKSDRQSVKSPDGMTQLLENLWLRHRAGMKPSKNNIFMVELPPPTPEELAAQSPTTPHSD